ncbi:MAG: type II toxin-antitoxin system VapC family toxin [Methylococcales bacterium]
MVAIDTNIIVRLLTRDDIEQYKISRRLFETEEIFIPDTVILETEWVLRFAYEFTPKDICGSLRKLFGLSNVCLSNGQLIAQTLDWHENGLDFADAFHLSLSQQQSTLKTFDENFIKRSKKLSKCRVEKP